ncbi:MAG: glutamine synthetase [Deltaproteobacteria bacterium]|nr:glutamine synthetase [Deltaproteobacteria bacterium]
MSTQDYTLLRETLENTQARFLDLKVLDLVGHLRHVSLPVEAVGPWILESGVGFDGSSYGYKKVASSDMVLIPDLATGQRDPFREEPTVSFAASVHLAEDGLPPSDQDSRGVLWRAVSRMRSLGVADDLWVAPEYEFHVLDDVEMECTPTACGFHIQERPARPGTGYHRAFPDDPFTAFRDDAVRVLVEHGVPVKYHHHECGPRGQMEIETSLAPITAAADHAVLVRYVLRCLADLRDLKVTFMPKPFVDEAGNGWHVHQMLKSDGRNLFYDPSGPGELSRTALAWIGGILQHGRALAAFANATTNSYKRLIPGFEAPTSLTFGPGDRTAAIRIPRWARAEDTRIEYRPGDLSGNPYLVLAGLLVAGLDGIENDLDPVAEGWGPDPSGRDRAASLPTSLDEALDALEADSEFLLRDGVFSQGIVERWIEVKRAESREVARRPHPYEYVLSFHP